MQTPSRARLSARLLALRGELIAGGLSALAKARASAEALTIRTQPAGIGIRLPVKWTR